MEGNDHQTLSHELRAYRDPVDVGMIEVIDLAQGCSLSIESASISLAPERATAVLIHEPTRLAPELRSLDFTRLPGIEEREILLYRFGYTVNRHEIPRTLDLRFADAREWFFETFRTPSDASDSLVPSPGEDADATLVPTIARSRFHLENGVPPVPEDFWSMLPTLINPDLGGGSPADTGSTLMMVGHWMRQHDVNALVFPSARW